MRSAIECAAVFIAAAAGAFLGQEVADYMKRRKRNQSEPNIHLCSDMRPMTSSDAANLYQFYKKDSANELRHANHNRPVAD